MKFSRTFQDRIEGIKAPGIKNIRTVKDINVEAGGIGVPLYADAVVFVLTSGMVNEVFVIERSTEGDIHVYLEDAYQEKNLISSCTKCNVGDRIVTVKLKDLKLYIDDEFVTEIEDIIISYLITDRSYIKPGPMRDIPDLSEYAYLSFDNEVFDFSSGRMHNIVGSRGTRARVSTESLNGYHYVNRNMWQNDEPMNAYLFLNDMDKHGKATSSELTAGDFEFERANFSGYKANSLTFNTQFGCNTASGACYIKNPSTAKLEFVFGPESNKYTHTVVDGETTFGMRYHHTAKTVDCLVNGAVVHTLSSANQLTFPLKVGYAHIESGTGAAVIPDTEIPVLVEYLSLNKEKFILTDYAALVVSNANGETVTLDCDETSANMKLKHISNNVYRAIEKCK